jgi:hypothetical protein
MARVWQSTWADHSNSWCMGQRHEMQVRVALLNGQAHPQHVGTSPG